MAAKTTLWARIRTLFRGKTMTYADYDGLTASDIDRNRAVDPMVTSQQSARSVSTHLGAGF